MSGEGQRLVDVTKYMPKICGFALSKNCYNENGDIYMPMTKLMEQVIAKVSALPPEEQEYYATIFLHELKDEQKWDDAFASSQDQLAELADEAGCTMACSSKLMSLAKIRDIDCETPF